MFSLSVVSSIEVQVYLLRNADINWQSSTLLLFSYNIEYLLLCTPLEARRAEALPQ